MAREIRISIDDDEVFERMKARKRELDLSWEEVLHRGLRRMDGSAGVGTEARREHEGWPHGTPRAGVPPRPPRDPVSDPRGFAEDLKEQIQGQVRESLYSSLGQGIGDESRDPLETEVTTLESAEDAVLVFDFLGEEAHERANQVPLRVTLEASSGGLAVEVVAVRQGKTVTDTNTFEPSVRKRIVEGLAAGNGATLRFEAGDEQYDVAPVLSWSRAGGRPTVASVAIEEVRFDVD